MKFTWSDVLIFIVGTTFGAFVYQWMKEFPDWLHVLEISYYQVTAILFFVLFVKFFGTSEESDTIESSTK